MKEHLKEAAAKKVLDGTAYGAIDSEFVYLTKRIRIPRDGILSIKPRRDGDGAIVVTRHGAIRVCEDYTAIMYHLCGVTFPERLEIDSGQTSGIADIIKNLRASDEIAAQVLNVLRDSNGVFRGTATELSERIMASMGGTSTYFNARRVGITMERYHSLFKNIFITHKPRLLHGRTMYIFEGLQRGVEL